MSDSDEGLSLIFELQATAHSLIELILVPKPLILKLH